MQDAMAETLMDCLGKASWSAYRETVGGKAFNGDPLPDWETMKADAQKETIVKGWKAAAIASLMAFDELKK